MSTKFSIDLLLYPSEMLQQYPDIEYNRDTFVYGGMYGGIKIEVNGETLKKFKGTQCITEDHYLEEYLWFFFYYALNSIIELCKGNDTYIGFVDSNNHISLKQSPENNILFSFDYGIDYPKSNIQGIPIKFEEYVQEIFKAIDRFMELVSEINVKARDSPEIVRLIRKRKEAEKAYQEYFKSHGKD